MRFVHCTGSEMGCTLGYLAMIMIGRNWYCSSGWNVSCFRINTLFLLYNRFSVFLCHFFKHFLAGDNAQGFAKVLCHCNSIERINSCIYQIPPRRWVDTRQGTQCCSKSWNCDSVSKFKVNERGRKDSCYRNKQWLCSLWCLRERTCTFYLWKVQ